MRRAILTEVQDLLNRGKFKFMLKEGVPDGENTLTARFILGMKSNANGKIKYKERYVTGGNRDKLEQHIQNSRNNINQVPQIVVLV